MVIFKSFIFIFLVHYAYCLPEQGIWKMQMSNDHHIFAFPKTMFNETTVYLKVTCHSDDPNLQIKVSWLLRYSPCADEYIRIGDIMAADYLSHPAEPKNFEYKEAQYKSNKNHEKTYHCNGLMPISLEATKEGNYLHKTIIVPPKNTTASTTKKSETTNPKKTKKSRQRRAAVLEPPKTRKSVSKSDESQKVAKKPPSLRNRQRKPDESASPKRVSEVTKKKKPLASNNRHIKLDVTAPQKTSIEVKDKKKKPALVTERPKGSTDDLRMYKLVNTWRDGAYLFVVNIHAVSSSASGQALTAKNGVPKFEGEVTVWMKSSYGYLSALEWPFLIFYGVMCLVYLGYGIAWIALSACHWRDLLRVQFWIGAVIVLGMLEKAVFYAEYQSINSSGHSVRGAVIFAEFVSCVKRTLARLLVMVVSIGYGIVKPRLGPALVKVVVIGIIYFIFALIEGCIRVLRPRYDMPRIILVVQVPLALVDAIILWWTFTYLVQTIQQMRLRRNLVKFNLYKHFSNILILVVGASVVFMGWSVFYHKWFACKKHWREIWVDDAFWHILFSVILLVIIWLWRPSKNNQRYAYSPVLDADDDADEDILMDNFTTGEMTKKSSAAENGTSKREPKAEDDLRWVEEHIPSSSAAENVFPLGDSDEEIATTKFHLNKME